MSVHLRVLLYCTLNTYHMLYATHLFNIYYHMLLSLLLSRFYDTPTPTHEILTFNSNWIKAVFSSTKIVVDDVIQFKSFLKLRPYHVNFISLCAHLCKIAHTHMHSHSGGICMCTRLWWFMNVKSLRWRKFSNFINSIYRRKLRLKAMKNKQECSQLEVDMMVVIIIFLRFIIIVLNECMYSVLSLYYMCVVCACVCLFMFVQRTNSKDINQCEFSYQWVNVCVYINDLLFY